jgi:hypothetical protein
MSMYASRSERMLVHDDDRRHPSFALTQIDQLGYWLLIRLDETTPDGVSCRYVELLPDVDDFELRGAASWLVTNGYARWSTGSSIAITELGRQAVDAITELTGRNH